jgi:tetratricopeptide (TPR) repeat protein
MTMENKVHRKCTSQDIGAGRAAAGSMARLVRQVCAATALAGFATASFAQAGNCGPLANAFGPFDYRTEKGNSLYLVESAHFTPAVEALIAGNTTYIGGDLDYTLRAFPNHHRALMSMMRLGEKEKTTQPRASRYSVECWLMRAVQFKPDDTIARLIYATFLGKNARVPEAMQQLEQSNTLAKDNAFTHYNIGLVYFDLKQYDKSLAQAHTAYGLGFPQPGLRDQLKAAGKWKEASAGAKAADSSAKDPAKDPAKEAANEPATPAADGPATAPAPAASQPQ